MDEWDKNHEEDTEGLEKDIRQVFLDAILKAAAMVTLIRAFRKEKPFRFEDYPATSERLQSLLNGLSSGIESLISTAIITQWDLANSKNDSLSDSFLGKWNDELDADARSVYYARNEEARLAFQKRRIDGLSLSDKVWNLTQQFRQEIELGLDIALRDGLSASQASRRLRQYLNEPERLFRRVRDEHGVLRLSQAAKAYHPGQGVYRSSYKNARRLAATETNIAYRTADYLRWQQLDFVVGIEIRLSNNHTCNGEPFYDICDELKGRYPKDFKFTGWHPLCRCIAVPVLKTEEEMAGDTEKILKGERPGTASRNAVKDVPEKFKKWIEDNKARIARSRSLPYFMRDNEKYVPQVNVTDEALKRAQASQKLNDELMKAARPTRIHLTDEQKAHRKELQKEAIAKFKGMEVDNVVNVKITASGIKEFLNQPHEHYFEKNELVLNLPELLGAAKYEGKIAYHKDNKYFVASHLYSIKIKNQISYLIAREDATGMVIFHSISDDVNLPKK